jgi:signal peptidase I
MTTEKNKKQGDILDFIWENAKALGMAIVLDLIIKTSIVEAYKVPTGSMEDTILVGDFILANKFIYGARLPVVDWRLPAVDDIEPGDIVIFKYPLDQTTNYIKRCVAGPGDIVEVRDKALYVNGQVFPDPPESKFTDARIKKRPFGNQDSRDNWGPHRVPDDCYFMMGDNRDNSADSRYWGFVPRDLILGEAMIIHWSWKPDDLSPKAELDDPLSVPKLFVYNIVHFFERVRWGRLLSPVS